MPKNKYNKWLRDIASVRGMSVDEMKRDDTYDYHYFYTHKPEEAQDMLNKDSDAHFTDIAKTANHPTFSNESAFSGKFDLIHNPRGIEGGSWSDAPHLGPYASRYQLSDSQIRNNWNVNRTINYLQNAEDYGAELVYPNGRRPTLADGSIFGGILPSVVVKPKRT